MTKAEFLQLLEGLRKAADKLPEAAEVKYACIDETFGISASRLRIGSGLREFAAACGSDDVQAQPTLDTTVFFDLDGVKVFQYEETV